MKRASTNDAAQFAPRMATRRWPQPVTDERWRGRLFVRGAALRDAWATFLALVPWEWFATLTIDPARAFPVGRELASREAFWWCREVGHLFRRPVGWAYGVERSAGGSWHAHALLTGVTGARKTAPKVIWRQRNGLMTLRDVTDVRGVALYTSKAVSDDEIVLSDTLARYQRCLDEVPRLSLYGVRADQPLSTENPVDFGMNREMKDQ